MIEACDIVRVLEVLKRNLLVVKEIKDNLLGNNDCTPDLGLAWDNNNSRNTKNF